MRISDWSSDVCSSDLPRRGPRRKGRWHRLVDAFLPRLRRTKLVEPSGIRPKSLPDPLFWRRRPRRSEVTLKQPVGDLEHLAEISPHPPELQRGEKAGAAKAVNQLRPDRDRHHAIAFLERKQTKTKAEGHAFLGLERYDAGIDGPKSRLVRSHPEGLVDAGAWISVERRVGKECVSRCRSRLYLYH